jgi:hypothetical protein
MNTYKEFLQTQYDSLHKFTWKSLKLLINIPMLLLNLLNDNKFLISVIIIWHTIYDPHHSDFYIFFILLINILSL